MFPYLLAKYIFLCDLVFPVFANFPSFQVELIASPSMFSEIFVLPSTLKPGRVGYWLTYELPERKGCVFLLEFPCP